MELGIKCGAGLIITTFDESMNSYRRFLEIKIYILEKYNGPLCYQSIGHQPTTPRSRFPLLCIDSLEYLRQFGAYLHLGLVQVPDESHIFYSFFNDKFSL
ncbi:MAG: hypothetical protein ACI9N9_002286 [Enterobacterales bacterium]